MSDSNRGLLAALAGIAALAVATGAGAFYGSIYAPEKRHHQSVGTNGGQEYPSDSPRNGLADVSGIDPLAESIIAKPQPRNTDEREQRDLAAQESTAIFAYWMFWAVVLQTLLAAGALFALVKDLRQNRESNERSLRAYLSFSDMNLSVFDTKKGGGTKRMEVETKIINGGQTPAYKCIHLGNIVALTQKGAEANFSRSDAAPILGQAKPYVVHNGRDTNAAFFSHEDISESDIQAVTDGKKAIFIYGMVVYEDCFGAQRKTRFCYELVSPLLPAKPDPSGVTETQLKWDMAPFHNDAT